MPTIALLVTLASAVTALKPFSLPGLLSHQPNGNPGGQVNYYRTEFTVNSTNSGTPKSGYCWKSWGDNGWTNPEAYSLFVPTGEWFKCDSSEKNLGDGKSDFEFKLFPYFSIGNFSIEIRETLKDKKYLYGYHKQTNKTDAYTCTINPQEIQYVVHASGDCQIADGKGPFKVPVSLKEYADWK